MPPEGLQTSMRGAAWLVLILLAPSAGAVLALPPLGEYPNEFSCDGASRRVCAGAEAGAWADCHAGADNASATCSWTHGWITRAWSAQAESGDESHAGAFAVDACSSVRGCTRLDAGTVADSCAWHLVLSCDDSDGPHAGNFTTGTLALGECFTLTVTSDVAIDARIPGDLAPLAPSPARASFASHDVGAGEWCRVDDGR